MKKLALLLVSGLVFVSCANLSQTKDQFAPGSVFSRTVANEMYDRGVTNDSRLDDIETMIDSQTGTIQFQPSEGPFEDGDKTAIDALGSASTRDAADTMDPTLAPSALPDSEAIKDYGDSHWNEESEVTLSPSDMTVQRGLAIWGMAGETLSAFRLVYKKANSRYYLYDADAADAATWLPVAMTTTTAVSAGDTVELVTGTFFLRCSDFAITFASYGAIPVYADKTTPGYVTITPPATSGDRRIIVGHMWGDDRIMMTLPVMADVVVP